MTAVLGMPAEPYTLRQLCRMVRRKRQEDWDHTAAVMALLANCHRNEKRRPWPFKPADFHPFRADRERGETTGKAGKPDPRVRQLLAEAMSGKRLPRPMGRWERFETATDKEPTDGNETKPVERTAG